MSAAGSENTAGSCFALQQVASSSSPSPFAGHCKCNRFAALVAGFASAAASACQSRVAEPKVESSSSSGKQVTQLWGRKLGRSSSLQPEDDENADDVDYDESVLLAAPICIHCSACVCVCVALRGSGDGNRGRRRRPSLRQRQRPARICLLLLRKHTFSCWRFFAVASVVVGVVVIVVFIGVGAPVSAYSSQAPQRGPGRAMAATSALLACH